MRLHSKSMGGLGSIKKLISLDVRRKKINQRDLMSSLAQSLNILEWKDWYKVTAKDILQAGGRYLLRKYSNSPSALVMSFFPRHPWNLLLFKQLPRNYLTSESNRRNLMKQLEKKLNILEWKDWYKVGVHDITRAGGSSLLNRFNSSPSAMVMSLLPSLPWNLPSFKQLPQHYWSIESNQRGFMKNLEKKLNISDWKDWYYVTANDIHRFGGLTLLLNYFKNSPAALIMWMYPQHPWDQYEFRTRFSWDPLLIRRFLTNMASNLHIDSKIAWRTLSTTQMKGFKGGVSLLDKVGSLYNALRIAFPFEDWNTLKEMKISNPQNKIVDILSKYISRSHIIVNHRHDNLIHSSGVKAELDIWIPSLNLALEYHGEHHFHQLWERSDNPSIREKRDTEKRKLCLEVGIDLVEVPYWWDKSEQQLIAMICSVRPDFHFNEALLNEQNVMIASRERIIVTYQGGLEYYALKQVEGWYISEKLDGIRGHWSGSHVYSRGNHEVKRLPSLVPTPLTIVVDGEIWYQRRARFGFGASENPSFLAFDVFCEQLRYLNLKAS